MNPNPTPKSIPKSGYRNTESHHQTSITFESRIFSISICHTTFRSPEDSHQAILHSMHSSYLHPS